MNQFDRGQAAARLLDDPVVSDALARLEQKAMDELLAVPAFSPFGDRKRRRLADRINAIRALKAELELEIHMAAQMKRPE